jgi:5,5'-dehydrodivanillate O-demethylase
MGPEPAPLLPRWGPLVWENAVRDICIVELPCNWLQCQENSLDPVHTEHLHGNAGSYFKQVIYRKEEPTFRYRPRHQKIGFDAFEHGIIKRRVTEGTTEDDDGWKVGHPVLFPNILFQGSPMHVKMQFRVPADDTHCLHISLYTWRAAPGADLPAQDVVPSRIVPLYEPGTDQFILNLQFNQDYMAWVTQGSIAKRQLEKLGESDRGIIMFRRMLLDQLERLRDGAEPSINVFRDPATNECINILTEIGNFSGETVEQNGRRTEDLRGYVPEEAGYSRDADKIVKVLETWQTLTANGVREFVGAV